LFPVERNLGSVAHGTTFLAMVPASSALVLSLQKQALRDNDGLRVTGSPGRAMQQPRHGSMQLQLQDIVGISGTSFAVRVTGSSGAVTEVVVNGVKCTRVIAGLSQAEGGRGRIVEVTMAGERVQRMMAASHQPVGNDLNFKATINVTAAMKAQMEARQQAYPIKWQPTDYKASWLVPSRLLLFLYIEHPSEGMTVTMMLDGMPTNLTRAYNSRGRGGNRCFLGFYYDLSNTAVGTHAVEVSLDGVPPGAFRGLFFENLEDSPTSSVQTCQW